MSRVRIEEWQEDSRGWAFRVVVARTGSDEYFDVHLSFRDHDYWCGGRLGPADLLIMILEYALTHYPGDWPRSFDAARVRRWLPGVDKDFHLSLGGAS